MFSRDLKGKICLLFCEIFMKSFRRCRLELDFRDEDPLVQEEELQLDKLAHGRIGRPARLQGDVGAAVVLVLRRGRPQHPRLVVVAAFIGEGDENAGKGLQYEY